jgi:pyridoxal phosphate enzyme (YggS family)
MSIRENAEHVRERIVSACKRSGRSAGDVQLMAVSKTQPVHMIQEAYEAGITVFGENRVQEFADKIRHVSALRIEWHLIGHLQSNKASKAAELFDGIDSVDSMKLAERLNRAAQEADKCLDVLIEINLGNEEQKAGLSPDSPELNALLRAFEGFEALQMRGLMCIPPQTVQPDAARGYFRRMRNLRDQLATLHLPRVELDELSMGMTHDFEIAIEEGSTMVRIGTAMFGEREKR